MKNIRHIGTECEVKCEDEERVKVSCEFGRCFNSNKFAVRIPALKLTIYLKASDIQKIYEFQETE